MATSNNDRISSQRLLDTLRGLQASRHLGSEPEVVTETTQHTYVPDQIPRPIGTPTSEESYHGAFKPTTEPLTLPIYVYGPYVVPVGMFSFDECEPTILATLNHSKEYTVDDKTFMTYGDSELPENYSDFGNSWNGYTINGSGDYWECVNTSEPKGRIYYFSDKQPVTEDITTTTKTKHPIKQDYVPNADWSQNDPDADGYVQGRTHWVERTVGDIPVTTESGMSYISEMVKPEGFKASTTTWKPDYEAVEFEEVQSGATFTGYILAEDENGNQVTDASGIFGGSKTFFNGVAIVDYSAFAPGIYIVSCRYNNQDTQVDYILGVTDVVHKLPKMYYEQTDEEALKNEVYTNIMSKLHYKQLTFYQGLSDLYEIDDTSEIEAFFTSNGYSSKTVNNEKVWYKDTSRGTVKFYIITELLVGHTYLFCDNDGDPVTFEYLTTSITRRKTEIASEEFKYYLRRKIMPIAYDKTNEKIFCLGLHFNKNNEIVTEYNNENVVIGSISAERLNINTNLFTVRFVYEPNIQNITCFTFIDGDRIQTVTDQGVIEYYNNYISAFDKIKISEYYVYDKVVNRQICITPKNYSTVSINANEEKTYTVDEWIPQSNDSLIINPTMLDDIIGKEFFADYEHTNTSNVTETRTIKYWVDSDYTLHLRNKYDGIQTELPAKFTFYLDWTPSSGEAKMWKTGDYYSVQY